MSKYSNEFKLKVVNAYLLGKEEQLQTNTKLQGPVSNNWGAIQFYIFVFEI